MWSWAVEFVAELDALMSLAAHALGSETAMCRPELLQYEDAGDGTAAVPPLFEAVGLIHPSGVVISWLCGCVDVWMCGS